MKPDMPTYVLTVTLSGVQKREAKTMAKYIRDMGRLMVSDQVTEMRPGMEVSITTAHVKDFK